MNLSDLPTNLPKFENDGACDHLLNLTIPDISLPTQDGILLKLNSSLKNAQIDYSKIWMQFDANARAKIRDQYWILQVKLVT